MDAPLIDVRAQHTIPPGKALSLCLKGIQHRMFRSLLTLMVIVLAVAFFMLLLCEAAFARGVGAGIDAENREVRFSERRAAAWFDEPGLVVTAERLSTAHREPARLAELSAVSGWSAERLAPLAAAVDRERRVTAFFADMDAGSRAALVGKARGDAIWAALLPEAEWQSFEERIRHLHALKPPLPLPELRAAIVAHPEHAKALAELAATWKRQIVELKGWIAADLDAANEERRRALLVRGDPAQLETLRALLARRGFADDAGDVRRVHEQAAAAALRDEVRERLRADEARSAWKKAFLVEPLVEQKMLMLGDERVPKIFEDPVTRQQPYTHEQLAAISRGIEEENTRADVERTVRTRLPPEESRGTLLSGRQAFLMAISFVVCMVGIANAMLMAITERFREIATMKCLGATDGFILQQFLIEAAIQGLTGGIAGTLIGGLLAIAKCAVLYGGYLFAYLPGLDMLIAGGICIVTGVLLSTLASIYPSWIASRMAPMDAMRIE